MARRQTVALVDDIDGGKAHETVAFGLDGSRYEIDLHTKKAAALRKSLAEFLAAARPVRPATPLAQSKTRRPTAGKARRPAGDPTAAEIREWAAAAGVRVSVRGRIADSAREQYLATRAD